MIYLDHSATSPLSQTVLEAMWPYLTTQFGNPSSHHALGKAAAAGLAGARDSVAEVLGCRPGEIVFTSGGTEANNLALKGMALARPRGRHIVTTAIEHEAILQTCAALQRHHGFEVDVVPVDGDGLVDIADVAAALRPDTTLCSVMYANNEVGTIEPVREIAALCREIGVPFHTDAVQAAGLLPIDVDELAVDLLSLSGHKFGGPKGIGALFTRGGLALVPVIDGGGQERGRRSGTENVAGAVGLATALRLAEQRRCAATQHLVELCDLRDRLISGVLETVPNAVLTGHRRQRLAHHASFCFTGISGEAVLLELEMQGIYCSSGSACAAGSDDPSHVLTAMGVSGELAQTAVRFTLGPETTQADIDTVVELVPRAVAALRY